MREEKIRPDMGSNAAPKTDFGTERWLWIGLMALLAVIAFLLLARDSRKQYGAVSFGVFPEFNAADERGAPYDHHRLKGQLSAIIVTDQPLPEDTVVYLRKLSRTSSHGNKYLHGLILTRHALQISDPWLQDLILSAPEYQRLDEWKNKFRGEVILVDQNGVVRGVFDLQDKLQRLNFEGAVRGIL